MEKQLSDLKPGEKVIITKVVGVGSIRRRMLDMGLVKGAEIIVIRRAPLGDPIEFELKGYKLSLRKDEAKNVFVEVEK
jgi:Fe2+ transport system protein FeoA